MSPFVSQSLTIPLTVARTRLFQLAEQLFSGELDRVVLSHRESAESLMLIRSAVVAALEAEVIDLRARSAPTIRPLRGLGRASQPVEDMLRSVRARQSAWEAGKRETLYPPIQPRNARVAERPKRRG
jgi:hypothetical protein